MNRRRFGKWLLKWTMIGIWIPTLFMAGCSAVSDLENWIPVALTAVSAIVKLLGPAIPAPVASTIVIIQAAFSALLTAIQNYKAGSGILTDISNEISAVETAFANFFSSLSVPSGLLSTIEGLAAIILSTIHGFADDIQPSLPAISATIGSTAVAYTPQKRSVEKFRSDWNSECVSTGHPEAKI